MDNSNIAVTYHVLLIGIDRYPPGYPNLEGCVNDIDSIEQLLLTPPGVDVPPEHIHITRIASPRADLSYTWRSQINTLSPTKDNVIQSLKALASQTVKPSDRVLIYYSGHGDEVLAEGSKVWHETLVPHNDHNVEYLFDVEINGLINAIAERTNDLTIILDACHSAGATRDFNGIKAEGTVRTLKYHGKSVASPDLTILNLNNNTAEGQDIGTGLLQSPNPDYLVVVACQSDETASEGAYPKSQPVYGIFTHSLLRILTDKDVNQRANLRWADIWPELLAKVAERSVQLNRHPQHPWIIGHSERKVFGGPWEMMDVGYQVTKRLDDKYEVGAGTLMGVTEGAEIAVYGSEPCLFPPIGSTADQPLGRLKISQAGPSCAVAVVIGAQFMLPEGVRGRLTKPGESQRLRISLKPADAKLEIQLNESPLLEVVSTMNPDADVEVIAKSGGGWIVGNETEPLLAMIPSGELKALRIGLEHYYRYVTVLRMSRNCNDPQLSNCLSARLLDCNDTATLNALSPAEKADPDLPDGPRDQDKVYALPSGFKFCMRVTNNSMHNLNVTLFNCSSGGLVEYLGDAVVRNGASHVIWQDNKLGSPFKAIPDKIPAAHLTITLPSFVTDRVIVIGTTRKDVNLKHLCVENTVNNVVEKLRRGANKSMRDEVKTESLAPAELWTATVIPVRIAR